MAVTFTWAVQAYLGGSWVDISADVMWKRGITAERGLGGSKPTDRVAKPGSLSYVLDNGEGNSGAALGYYSPDHASLRSGFGLGLRTRLKISSGGTDRYVFHGYVTRVSPVPGAFRERVTSVVASDYMKQFAIHKLKRIPVQTDKRTDQLLTTIIGNMPIAPLNTSYATGPATFAYSLQDEQDEKTYAITAVQKAGQSDVGFVYVRGNTTDGETLVYESRHTRILNTTSLLTLNDTMTELEIERDAEDIFNNIGVPVTPATVDAAATTVLASIPDEFYLAPGESSVLTMRFVDPSGAGRRISGVDLVDPFVADTHYKMSSVAQDGGNDLNADLTVDYATDGKGGNAADVEVTNNGSRGGYVNMLQVWGKGVYLYDTQEMSAEDSASQLAHGDRILTYQVPYESSLNVGQDIADELKRRYANPFTNVSAVMFLADENSTLMNAALTLDIGSRITLTETVTGISTDFFINGVRFSITPQRHLQVRYVLERASLAPFSLLNDASNCVLDSTAYLSF